VEKEVIPCEARYRWFKPQQRSVCSASISINRCASRGAALFWSLSKRERATSALVARSTEQSNDQRDHELRSPTVIDYRPGFASRPHCAAIESWSDRLQ
jgi:hypothetical protein